MDSVYWQREVARGLATMGPPVVLVLVLAACAVARDERAARVVGPTPESRAELAAVISRALHGRDVLLADDALVASSRLVIERRRPRTAEERLATGREMAMPHHFELVVSGRRCLLIHRETGRRTELRDTQCAAE